MPLPVLPTATDVPPKAVLFKLLNPASCLLLASTSPEFELDDTFISVDGMGVDPNLKKEVVEDGDATTEVEELLLVDAVTAEAKVVMLELVGAMVAERDELLNRFGLVVLFET